MWPFCHRGCMPSGGFSFLVEPPLPFLPLSMRFDTAERNFGQFCHVFVEVGLTKLVPKLVCCLCQFCDASLPFQSHGRGGFFMRTPLPPVSQTFFFPRYPSSDGFVLSVLFVLRPTGADTTVSSGYSNRFSL